MWYEIKKKFEYHFYVLFCIDGTWDGCAVLTPFGGMWINENGMFKSYSDAEASYNEQRNNRIQS